MSVKLRFVNGSRLGNVAWASAHSRSWSFGAKCVPKLELGTRRERCRSAQAARSGALPAAVP